MKKTYWKFLKRSVWRTKARFFAILGIVAIGVGFLGGLTSATPDMRLTISRYYDEHRLHDFDIKGPMGITGDDITALSNVDGVESVTPAYVTDLVMEDDHGAYTARIYGMPLGEDTVNGLKLVDGRLPETAEECVVVALGSYSASYDSVGTYRISKNNKDYDKLGDTYAFTELQIVGVVETPLHFSRVSEPSTVGSGSVQLILFVPSEAYSLDVYTDAFVRLSEARSMDTFSEEYEALSGGFTDTFETLGAARSQIRYDEIAKEARDSLAEGQEAYDKGKTDADKALTEAAQKLEDGQRELADGKQKLEDGAKQLEDGKKELADGEKAYEAGKATLESGRTEAKAAQTKLADSRKELDLSQKTLNDTITQKKAEFTASIPGLVQEQYAALKSQIDTAEAEGLAQLAENEQELNAGKAALETGKQELATRENQLAQSRAQLDTAQAQYSENLRLVQAARQQFNGEKAGFLASIQQQRDQLETITDPDAYEAEKARIDAAEAQGLAQFDANEAPLIEQESALAAGKQELDAQEANWSAGQQALEAGRQELAANEVKITEGFAQLAAGRTQLTEEIAKRRKELENSRPQIQAAVEQQGYAAIEQARADAQAQIDSGLAQIQDSEAQLNASLAQIESGQKELNSSLVQLEDAKRTIAEKEAELKDAQAKISEAERELTDGEAEYITEKAKAEQKLADAQLELTDAENDIAAIKLPEWLVFDRDDNPSFSSYKADSGKVAAIATIFPIFFFLVAALVALTTMTRLVEEERTQIGVFKALGYSNRPIIFYYLGYSVLASLMGSIIGIIFGTYTLPTVIASAYNMSYTAPPLVIKFWWGNALLIILIATLCTTAAAWAACMSQLREKPSQLMQQRAPQTGKRILLERISPLWKRLSFTQKITARNIFRYKKRLFMTVFGIAGCAALLVTAFGMRDSIQDIGRKQFGEIYKYNVSITLKEGGAAETDPVVSDLLSNPDYISAYAEFHTENAYAGSRSCTLLAPKSAEAFKTQMNLREMSSGKDLEFNDTSVIVTQKLSENLGVKPGDSLTLKNGEGVKAQVTVTGVAENYVSDYVYLGAALYEESFGSAPSYTGVTAVMAEDSDQLRERLSEQMLQSDKVMLTIFNHDIEKTFNDMVKNMDAVVMVLIVSAGALAMIVLYNLTNINICERKKELATIKVLGFHQSELAGYIYRETTILCILGILAGCVLGIFLHAFVISTAEVDAVMFGRTIYPMSYLLSAGATLLFTAVVDLIMLKKLRKIDMVESMKANE